MDASQFEYNDTGLVDTIISEIKSQGSFDTLRRDCLADADTKPAYQNIRQRIENSVSKLLEGKNWGPEESKNKLRDSVRKHMMDMSYLESSVDRVVNQVMNAKVYNTFVPKVEEAICSVLGLEGQNNGLPNSACKEDKPEIRSMHVITPQSANEKFVESLGGLTADEIELVKHFRSTKEAQLASKTIGKEKELPFVRKVEMVEKQKVVGPVASMAEQLNREDEVAKTSLAPESISRLPILAEPCRKLSLSSTSDNESSKQVLGMCTDSLDSAPSDSVQNDDSSLLSPVIDKVPAKDSKSDSSSRKRDREHSSHRSSSSHSHRSSSDKDRRSQHRHSSGSRSGKVHDKSSSRHRDAKSESHSIDQKHSKSKDKSRSGSDHHSDHYKSSKRCYDKDGYHDRRKHDARERSGSHSSSSSHRQENVETKSEEKSTEHEGSSSDASSYNQQQSRQQQDSTTPTESSAEQPKVTLLPPQRSEGRVINTVLEGKHEVQEEEKNKENSLCTRQIELEVSQVSPEFESKLTEPLYEGNKIMQDPLKCETGNGVCFFEDESNLSSKRPHWPDNDDDSLPFLSDDSYSTCELSGYESEEWSLELYAHSAECAKILHIISQQPKKKMRP